MIVLKNKALRSITLAVLMAAGLLVAGLLASVKPAQATFPGDNGRIAFSSDRGSSPFRIYSVSSTGREVDLNPVTTQLSGNADLSPSYSPDGTKIAFQKLNAAGNWDIWTINSSGGQNANQITDNVANDMDPTWSPDGKRIAFMSNRAPTNSFQIYSVSSTGREVDLNPVTTQLSGTDRYPVYSPDGTKIAFARSVPNASPADIWTINSSGGQNANQITDNVANDITPDYSPDGKRIAFGSDRGGSLQIYSVSSTGRETDLNPVTTQLSGTDRYPVYSPDGTKIAFQRKAVAPPNNSDIWTISSSGGQNTNQITDNIASDVNPTWESLLPTGNPTGNTEPTITNVRPAPNSKIHNRSPLIKATVRDAEDNLTATDIKLFVDTNPIAGFSYDSTTDKLRYQSNQLSRVRHSVRIVATDSKGLSAQKTWSFTVR